MSQCKERERRRLRLESALESPNLKQEDKDQLIKQLVHRETEFLRLKRARYIPILHHSNQHILILSDTGYYEFRIIRTNFHDPLVFVLTRVYCITKRETKIFVQSTPLNWD